MSAAATEVATGAVLDALQRETTVLVDRALTVFLEYDFLDYAILDGALTGGHVMTYLAREADRMANEVLAASGRVVPPRDRGREWDVGEGGELRPGAVLIDDLHVATDRLDAAARGLEDWRRLPARARAIPEHRLLQVIVHHADLGRPWESVPDDDAELAAAAMPRVLADELAGLSPSARRDLAELRALPSPAAILVEGPAQALIAWATGRGAAGIPADVPRPPLRTWI